MIYEEKELSYKDLPNLSAKLLREHHDVLYRGYVRKLNQIGESLANLDRGKGNATFSDYRELKIEESFAYNAVRLHELYFENMGGKGAPSDSMVARIAESFMAFQDFELELMDAGLSARGWVILGQDEDGQLRIHICDAHNMNGIWGSRPILVMDVYEHAYFLDFGANRKSYIDGFIKNIEWDVVEKRLS